MAGSTQTINVVQKILASGDIKSALSELGWYIDRSTITMAILQKKENGQEFSAFVSWQERNHQTIVSLRVLETTSREAQQDCDKQAQAILETLGITTLKDSA